MLHCRCQSPPHLTVHDLGPERNPEAVGLVGQRSLADHPDGLGHVLDVHFDCSYVPSWVCRIHNQLLVYWQR